MITTVFRKFFNVLKRYTMDVDSGFIPDNRSGNSSVINRPGIPDYVPFRYANDNIRFYVNPRKLKDPKTAVIEYKPNLRMDRRFS